MTKPTLIYNYSFNIRQDPHYSPTNLTAMLKPSCKDKSFSKASLSVHTRVSHNGYLVPHKQH